jgi:hypothetical protein
MTISAQSLKGTELANFNNKLNTANRLQRAQLEKDIGDAVKIAIANMTPACKAAVQAEIAKQVKAKLNL